MPFENALYDMTFLGQEHPHYVVFDSIKEYHKDLGKETPLSHSKFLSNLKIVSSGIAFVYPPSGEFFLPTQNEIYSGHVIAVLNSRCSFERRPGVTIAKSLDDSIMQTFDLATASLTDKTGEVLVLSRGKFGLSEYQQERIGSGRMQIYPVLIHNPETGRTWLRDYQTVPFSKDSDSQLPPSKTTRVLVALK